MSLTKKKAILECKELWKPVAEGEVEDKYDALILLKKLNPALSKIISGYQFECPLCELINHCSLLDDCSGCPYVIQFGHDCMNDDMGDCFECFPHEFALNVMKLKEG